MTFLMLKQWKGTKLNTFCYLVEVSSKLSVLKERGFKGKNCHGTWCTKVQFLQLDNAYLLGVFVSHLGD